MPSRARASIGPVSSAMSCSAAVRRML
jgi:hypothetical protein